MAASRTPLLSPAAGPRLWAAGLRGWTVLVLLFLYLPVLVLVVYSFNSARLGIGWEGFSGRWYAELLRQTPLQRAALNSLVVATATTLLAVVLGTAGAWLLQRYRFPGRDVIESLVNLPMVMPEILLGISLLVLFALAGVGLGFTTVIIGHVTFSFPFVLVAVRARLQGLDPALEEAARDLGATPWGAFRLVILPALRPAILAGGLMAFLLSWDELIVTYFTASAASATLPLKVFGLAKVGLNPVLNALSALFLLVTLAGVAFSAYLRRGVR
ncbi:MAG: ABC transporter permease [Opitutaceae bacterium]